MIAVRGRCGFTLHQIELKVTQSWKMRKRIPTVRIRQKVTLTATLPRCTYGAKRACIATTTKTTVRVPT